MSICQVNENNQKAIILDLDGTQIYHNMEMIYGCKMDKWQSEKMIEELIKENANADFVVSVGKNCFVLTKA